MDKKADSLRQMKAVGFWNQSISINIVIGVILVIMFNLIDAFITLYLIFFFKAKEINPFMSMLLAKGPFSFFFVKYLLVAVGMILIGVHSHQHRLTRRMLFYILLPLYLLLAIYQFVLVGIAQ